MGSSQLAHYGVKGMKWGVRKETFKSSRPQVKRQTESMSVRLKNGDTLTLSGDVTPAVARLLSKVSSSVRDTTNNTSNFTIRDPKGDKVGEMTLFKESPTSLNVVWVGVRDKHRGNGYASAAMRSAIEHAKKQGLDTITLEVPGNSPDARHIYEKLGFKEIPTPPEMAEDDVFWGGLTNMKLDLNAKHSEIMHYGVKGMKWGVRRAELNKPNAGYTDRTRSQDAKLHGKRTVKKINQRMNRKGENHAAAKRKVLRNKSMIRLAAAGALYATPQIIEIGSLTSGSIAQRAQTKRGEAAVAAAMGLPYKGSNNPRYSKQKRNGVYNISSM